MVSHFAKRLLVGLGFEVPLALVGCLIGFLLSFLAIEFAFAITTALGFVGCIILCYVMNYFYENEFSGLWNTFSWGTKTRGVKYWKVFLCLLPGFVIFAASVVLIVLFFYRLPNLVLLILGFTASYWLVFWFNLLIYYARKRCPICKCVFSMNDVKTLSSYSGEGDDVKYHSGSGIIGGVYDKNGTRVGDVRGDTSYTTTHHYSYVGFTYLLRCKYCGGEKKRSEHNSCYTS